MYDLFLSNSLLCWWLQRITDSGCIIEASFGQSLKESADQGVLILWHGPGGGDGVKFHQRGEVCGGGGIRTTGWQILGVLYTYLSGMQLLSRTMKQKGGGGGKYGENYAWCKERLRTIAIDCFYRYLIMNRLFSSSGLIMAGYSSCSALVVLYIFAQISVKIWYWSLLSCYRRKRGRWNITFGLSL